MGYSISLSRKWPGWSHSRARRHKQAAVLDLPK
ncbi:hypothetical protein GBAR_LOCUS5336 [Geodia barretti]|uniref:Uncharacterized protein n=1 Tax=Geodia barretti TaxID=519541 RepID=A0AA35RA58_GEOBA|nr:hypothetical protein GBAR_LOCUS5336 [Geodia barretti]